ncbi:activating signal cointegrator 1 complex subunit 2-like protein [Abeliophyllum distichum]|uniref:Activating signal cointegrator 1 complex subunit 2-like protein n=1 Tax=Abeliophyllum distichum TaxID=126358 RepID=A0ABD1URH4_9LAMI
MDVKFEDERPERSCDLDDDDENLSFSKELKAREFLIGFKMLHMENYNGRDNPTDYKMRLLGYIPSFKCRNFLTTLVPDVKMWYNKSKPESITSWSQLKQEFINTFIAIEQ